MPTDTVVDEAAGGGEAEDPVERHEGEMREAREGEGRYPIASARDDGLEQTFRHGCPQAAEDGEGSAVEER